MLHAVADGNRGPVTPSPPPTPEFLLEASAAQATSSVREMTPEQQADLRDEVSRMPEGDRDALANALAAKLPAEQLQQLEPVFGAEVIREAVETRSPATVREDYQQLTGTRPDIDAPAGSGRTEQEQVEQAREDYAEQVSGMGLPSNTLLTELMAANAGDPAYLAELVRLADEEGLFDDVVFPIGTLFEKDADGNYVLEDAGDRRDAFALALQAALDRGTISETRLRELAVDSPDWQDAAARAGVGQVGATGAARETALEFDELLDTQESAQGKVDKLDEELGNLLASAGPMTEEQQAAFIEAFRNDPDHKPACDDLIASTQAVSDFVAENQEALLDAAVRDPEVAAQVATALETLARNGHGVQALELLIEIQRAPDSALGEAFAGFDLSGDVLTDAASSAMSELLARNDGSITAAQAQFETLMAAIGEGAPAWGGYKDFSDAQKLLNAMANGDFGALDLYANRYNETPPVIRAFLAAGIVVGAVSATSKGLDGEYVEAIGGFAQTGENAARLVAGAMNSLADSGRLAQYSGHFAGAAGFAAKLAPALGLIAHAASFAHNFGEAVDGNPAYAIALFGDVLGVLGSALEFTPAAPAGFIISGIGAIISGLGSFVGELINGAERRAELKEYLREAGVDPAIVDGLVASGKQLFEMAEALDLDAGQLQELLKAHPEIASSPGHVNVFQEVVQAHGLSGDEVAAFADGLAATDEGFAWDLFAIKQGNPDPSDGFYRSYVESRYPEAAAVAQEASPELYGEAAEQRDMAAADYNYGVSTISWDMTLANMLERNDHAAYRAEMIGLIADSGGLEHFAQSIGIYGDRWEGAVSAAVADAVEAGRISQDDADMVMSHFD